MKRFFLAALLLFAAVAFTGWDNDDDDLYDTLSGRVWAGDLGFYQDGRIPLDSYVYFGADGFGTDELRYADTGRYLDTLNIQWDAYDDTVYIDYGFAEARTTYGIIGVKAWIYKGEILDKEVER